MKSWESVHVPEINAHLVPTTLRLTNSRTGGKELIADKRSHSMYVCGITPYDATHLGHAATYVSFDLINRYLLAQGSKVEYVQNITDIDDPLLERAHRDGVDWNELAASQIQLFRGDMQALRVLAPTHYVGAVESIPLVIDAVEILKDRGAIYSIENDYYFHNSPETGFGGLAHLEQSEMEIIFSQRGGNPALAGKLSPLDCLVWMAQRENEPGWPGALGEGRPGWHIECTAIAMHYLSKPSQENTLIDIQGGGSDLVFPHHEMCRSQARVLSGKELAAHYVHAGMIGLDGEKMSKSKGNLLLVSTLIEQGSDPMALRYALMSQHYRQDRMWSPQLLVQAEESLNKLRIALTMPNVHETLSVCTEIADALADDLDTPRALRSLQEWSHLTLEGASGGDASQLQDLIDALLGLSL